MIVKLIIKIKVPTQFNYLAARGRFSNALLVRGTRKFPARTADIVVVVAADVFTVAFVCNNTKILLS